MFSTVRNDIRRDLDEGENGGGTVIGNKTKSTPTRAVGRGQRRSCYLAEFIDQHGETGPIARNFGMVGTSMMMRLPTSKIDAGDEHKNAVSGSFMEVVTLLDLTCNASICLF